MDDFEDRSRAHYFKGGPVGVKGAAKISKVMREYKAGTLHSGSGPKVENRKQAVAIALSEARQPVKKAAGGLIHKTSGPLPLQRPPARPMVPLAVNPLSRK